MTQRLRKLLAAVVAVLLAPASAFAQTTYSPGQTGAVGDIVTANDPNGRPRQVVRPHVVCDSGCASPTVPANFATGQGTVGTSAAQLVAARSGRQSVTIVSNCANPIELGSTSGVTTANGVILPGVVGASITLNYSGAVYAIGAASCAVSLYELY